MKYKELRQFAKAAKVKTAVRRSISNRYSGFVVAYVPATELRDNRMVFVSTSYCAVEDAFKKKIGKELALNRMFNGDFMQLPIGQELSTMETKDFKEYLLDIFDIHY